MQHEARPSTVTDSSPRTSTGRVTKSSLARSRPSRNVSRSAIWKKNGRLSVGGEMSAATSSTAAPGPPGRTRAAKIGSLATCDLEHRHEPELPCPVGDDVRVRSLKGSGPTSTVARSTSE